MNWKHLEEVLNEYGTYLIEASKRNMPDYFELRNNIRFDLKVQDAVYEIDFIAPEYWKWAEDGRKAGKMPPVQVIKDWILKRKITPKASSKYGVPSINSLAYLIARKIGRDGTTGVKFLEKSVSETENYFISKISDAIVEDIKENLDFLIVL